MVAPPENEFCMKFGIVLLGFRLDFSFYFLCYLNLLNRFLHVTAQRRNYLFSNALRFVVLNGLKHTMITH